MRTFEDETPSEFALTEGEETHADDGFSGFDLLAPAGDGLSPGADGLSGSTSSLAPPPHLSPNVGMASPERRLSPMSLDRPAKVWNIP